MAQKKKIILIANYLPDKQQSMRLFAEMLERGFIKHGVSVEKWQPLVFLGIGQTTNRGFSKWLGYIDKWIIFPPVLMLKVLLLKITGVECNYHICDHSNSFYLRFLPKNRTVITCHDVLAIRGAMGYADAYCPASYFGKILQKNILKNLLNAKRIIAVSNFTYNQLNNLFLNSKSATINEKKDWTVIHNAFNGSFSVLDKNTVYERIAKAGIVNSVPYVLHVGASGKRKNRKLLVLMIDKLSGKWNGKIVFAGQAIDAELKALITPKNLEYRVISLVRPNHELLEALYNGCQAFIFPSYSEGFGWPVIEAQACGVPVIASNVEPMPEISGNAALHVNPDNADDFANALLSLNNTEIRHGLINKGFENCKRFEVDKFIIAYLKFHGLGD